MAEQPATNPNRLPLFKVYRGATLKGARVELLGTPGEKPIEMLKPNDRVWVREFLHCRAPESQTPLCEVNIEWRNLERVWRTKVENDELVPRGPGDCGPSSLPNSPSASA